MTSTAPLDHDARSIVVADLHRNLFVEAGAGTGKTTTLVSRIERLIATGHLPEIRQLAAITFTEAAAGELRDRIRSALERAADPVSAADRTPVERERCRVAAARIDEAVITTLHGFAQRILAEHPVAAGLPPAFEVDEGIPAELEFVARWSSFVDGLLADAELDHVLRVGATLSLSIPRLGEIARLLKDRWDRLDPVEVNGAPSLALDASPIVDSLRAVVALYAPHAADDDKLVRHIHEHVLPVVEAYEEAAATGDEFELLRVLDAVPMPGSGGGGTQATWGAGKALVIAHLKAAKEAREELLERLRGEVLSRLAPELVRFTLTWAQERRRAGRLHFHDLLVLARDLLWSDAAVRAVLAQRWSVLVIDEFQDTDPLQVELVFALAAADPTTLPATWEDIELAPGRVVVVGDPKQSIYGFRGADITLWNRTRRLFGHDGVVNLSQNYRSVDLILQWVNEIFERLIGEGDGDAQPAYAALQHHRTSLDAGHDVVFLGGPHSLSAAEVRMREAGEIAGAIATMRASGHTVADDRPGAQRGECRAMRYDDVAILVPTRAPVGAIERALDDADIPYRIESRSLVWRTDAVREILAILTAIEDPSDEVAVVAALRSAAFACTDTELLAWRRAGGRWDHTRTFPGELAGERPDDPAGDPPVALPAAVRAAMGTLRGWHDDRHWAPVDVIVDRVLAERRLFELTMAQRRPRDHWRRLRFVADQARAFVESGGASLAEFLAWASLQTSEGATAVETVVPEPDDDAVRILTVHGAKGLEFPVVVLAGLSTARPPSLTDVAWTPKGPEVMVTAMGGGKFMTAGWASAKTDARRFDDAESIRLLYVAATRARDTLLVSLHHSERAGRDTHAKRLMPLCAGTKTTWTPSDAVAVPAPLFGDVGQPSPRTSEERASWLADHEAAIAASRRATSVSPTGLAALRSGSGADDDDDSAVPDVATVGDEPDVDDGAAGLARRGGTAVGRAVHAVLETMPLDGTAPVDTSALAALAARFAAEEAVEVATVLDLAGSAARSSTLADARAAGRLWREVPVVVPIGDRILEGFIDLLYERSDGSVVVVDWKTDRSRSEVEVDAALDRYRLQGAGYAAAVGAATGKAVAEVRFVFCRPNGEPAVERTIVDLAGALTEVAALLQ